MQSTPSMALPVIARRMPVHGWAGLAIILVSEFLLLARIHPVATAFTAINWSGYILFVDGLVWARAGTSLLVNRRREALVMGFLSALCWLFFEVFNFRMRNWAYTGLPPAYWEQVLLLLWSYATIFPALFLTVELLNVFGLFKDSRWPTFAWTPFRLALSAIVGLAFVIISPAVPEWLGPYMVPFVWTGFIFLLEPINYRLGAPSAYRAIEEGRPGIVWRFVVAGFICGFFWESWNFQALHFGGTVWWYYVPELYTRLTFDLKYGEMPLVGFLGYPPFVWECYAMYQLLKWTLQGDRLWRSPHEKAQDDDNR